jgi:hypothetical protein
MDPDLVSFGRELSRAQDPQLRVGLDLEHGRSRLLKSVAAKPRRWPAVVLIAAAMALAGAWVFWSRKPRPLEFHVDNTGVRGQLGQLLVAPASAPVRLGFSDGSKLELSANSRGRVVGSHARGATVQVEQGTLAASIVRRANSQWQVQMGPFAVDVIGTRFDTSWHAETQRFSLSLHEGSVSVSGPVVGAKRTVAAGETLSVSCADGELTLVRTRAEPVAPSKAELTLAVDPDASALAPKPSLPMIPRAPAASGRASALSPLAPEVTPDHASMAPDFRTLARSHEYGRALEAAERAGFEALCRSEDATDLLLLGDAARLAGKAGRAEQAYRAVRERFRGSSSAQAAFLLGRLAFETRSAYGDAAQHFALSLLEAPNGPFARDAAGRLMESLDRAGDVTGARAAAERYLARYPDGPHARFARALLAKP